MRKQAADIPPKRPQSFASNHIALVVGADLVRGCLENREEQLDELYWRTQAAEGLDWSALTESDREVLLLALTHARLSTLVAMGVKITANRN